MFISLFVDPLALPVRNQGMKMAAKNAVIRGIQQVHTSSVFPKPPPPLHLGVGFGYPTRFRGVGVRAQGISSNPNPNWKIKMLYDGECPLCMREVDMLKQRNKQFQAIKFVDISSDDYSPAENQDLDYRAAMGRIHAILADGTVITDVEPCNVPEWSLQAFRKLYEAVNLGWVYSVTKYEPIATIANSVYGVWAKYRLQITGRPPLEEVIEAKLKKKAETCGDKDTCKM